MKTAMILAAGRGERLRPLTDFTPKALCVVNEKPLIEHHVVRLAMAGFEKIVINHAYLGGQIRQFLGNGQRYGVTIHYSPEPPGGLETGGGIVNALPLLGNTPFLTVNADIVTDFDFACINLDEISTLHLILTENNADASARKDFNIVNHSVLSNDDRRYIFSGIAAYHPAVFSTCKPGRYSVTPLIREYAEKKQATAGLHCGLWFDIGTPDRLKAAVIVHPVAR